MGERQPGGGTASAARAPRRGSRRGRWTAAALAGGCVALGLFAVVAQGGRVDPVSAALFDAWQRLAPRQYDPATPVRVVAIDGESLRRFGQWPWPRSYFVELIDRLEALGAAAIAFDVLFAEPDRASPERAAAAARLFVTGRAPPEGPTENDRVFARRLERSAVTLGALPAESGGAPFVRKFGLAFAGSDPRAGLRAAPGVEAPMPLFVEAATGYGLAGVGDGGGVVREAQMLSRVGDELAPSLTLEALRVAQGARNYLFRASDASGEAGGGPPALTDVRAGAVIAPLSPDGAMWLRFAGERPERLVPAWRILESAAPDPALADEIAGRIVLVGATAPGLRYVVETPLAAGVDAVTVHAEALEQMIAGVHLSRPDWFTGLNLVIVALAGLVAHVVVSRRGPVFGAAVTALALASLFTASWWAFVREGLLLSPVAPAATGLVAYVALTAHNYLRALGEERVVRDRFARFVAPEVIREMVEDPDGALRGRGALRPLTLMFVDGRGFTTLSETMPPERLIDYLNAFLTEVSETVLAHGGTVDKFLGDGVMAFWNAPLDCPDHESRAVRALLALGEAGERLDARYAAEGLPALRFGVGLNTGLCSVGLMGSPRRLDYSCIGDTVNVASRLQDLSKALGVRAVLGAATAAGARGFCLVELDEAPIRGRSAPEPVSTVLGPAARDEDGDVRAFRAAVGAVRAARRAGDGAALAAALAALEAAPVPGVDVATLAAWHRRRAAEGA
jgi:adenylate cyclase